MKGTVVMWEMTVDRLDQDVIMCEGVCRVHFQYFKNITGARCHKTALCEFNESFFLMQYAIL